MSEPVRQILAHLGPKMPLSNRMALANLWLFGPLIERQLGGVPATNSLNRTTTAPTIFEGSVRENVLPIRARAVINFRILPGESSGSVLEHVRSIVDDARVRIAPLSTRGEPIEASSTTSPGFDALRRTIREIFLESVVAPSLVAVTTDSRHYVALSRDIYRFMPLMVDRADLNRIHGTNDRVSVRGYGEGIKFYRRLIRNLAS